MDYKLDEKTRESLIGLMPVTQNAVISFIPPIYTGLPEKVRPIFSQRAFTRGEKQEVASLEETYMRSIEPYMRREGDNMIVNSESAGNVSEFSALSRKHRGDLAEWARKTVTGWRAVYDPSTGAEIAFKADADGGADKDLFDGFCSEAKGEIFQNAKKISSLLPQERVALKS
jgi:hypothetical protein